MIHVCFSVYVETKTRTFNMGWKSIFTFLDFTLREQVGQVEKRLCVLTKKGDVKEKDIDPPSELA
jgi:hypothetical protein